MHRSIAAIIALGVSAALAAPALAGGGTGGNAFRARSNGFQEVPAVSTGAGGQVRVQISANRTSANYRLTYQRLESDVLFAHIHFGRPSTNGGIIVFLCDNTNNPDAPADTPACPERGGEVTGTLTAEDVIGPEDQGIAPGQFGEFLRALRQGATYVNVHTDTFDTGEIRGNIQRLGLRPARR